MTDIKSMTLPELRDLRQGLGEPAFRGKQVFSWLSRGVTGFDEMSNLPLFLRERLKETCALSVPKAVMVRLKRAASCGRCKSRRWREDGAKRPLGPLPFRWARAG